MAVPALTPVTTPPLTVALPFDEVQVPPEVASVSVVLVPGQTPAVPEIAAGVAGAPLTLTIIESYVYPQLLYRT